MVWCIQNDLDFAAAKAESLEDRVPFMELSAITELQDIEVVTNTIEKARDLTSSPRIIKTHLSFDMLPTQVNEKKNKIIYVTRNPRDACVSFFNHFKILDGYTGTFPDFVNSFLDDACG